MGYSTDGQRDRMGSVELKSVGLNIPPRAIPESIPELFLVILGVTHLEYILDSFKSEREEIMLEEG